MVRYCGNGLETVSNEKNKSLNIMNLGKKHYECIDALST